MQLRFKPLPFGLLRFLSKWPFDHLHQSCALKGHLKVVTGLEAHVDLLKRVAHDKVVPCKSALRNKGNLIKVEVESN